jgi:hypothetical protein
MTDSQSASLSWCQAPIWDPRPIFLSLVRQLRVYYIVAPSLTRERVCNLLYNCFWALPEQSLLGRSPTELTTIFYCHIWDSPNLEGQIPVFTSPRNRVVQLYPRTLGSLWTPLTTLGTRLCIPASEAKHSAWRASRYPAWYRSLDLYSHSP